MSQNKPEADLKRDLQGIASDLKWSVVELKRIAERLDSTGNQTDSHALRRMIEIFQRGEVQLNQYVEEVKDGRIQRPAATPAP
ncbi:hypothetical protein [Pseudomonas sp. NPDC007930]|uniref:hypothetical protein n=1 Tax=Pseudomonas sp. NPDC007930 TaxID=3364417 RepID=UPI0036E50258